MQSHQLIYYIAPGAPPLRTTPKGNEPYMRMEVGFNPSWFHDRLGIDFGEKWHESPEYRLEAALKMKKELKARFPGRNIGESESTDPPDLLTGLYGIAVTPMLFGFDIQYYSDKWPVAKGRYLSDREVAGLKVPDVENNRVFHKIIKQIETITNLTGQARGFLNWQGVLNIAFKLRGEQIFVDIYTDPGLAGHLFSTISETLVTSVKALHKVQKELGTENHFATISNCMINMICGDDYKEFLLPYDKKIRSSFENFAIHNCAWNATPYLEHYATIPGLGYLDMGIETDLAMAKELFPDARRNILYRSTDLLNKSSESLVADFERIASVFAPSDVGLPDIETNVPDEKILFVMDLCEDLSEKYRVVN